MSQVESFAEPMQGHAGRWAKEGVGFIAIFWVDFPVKRQLGEDREGCREKSGREKQAHLTC